MIELDKRIISSKKPLTAFDEIDSKFIGKDCYFSDYAGDYGDLSNCQKGCLLSIDGKIGFNATKNNSYATFNYCLPCEWVEESKKKYRPFSLAEWIDKHEIGNVIHYRCKSEGIEFRHMYMGYAFGKGKDITKINVGTVTLGVANYSFDYLVEDYEIEIDGEWKPFGVEE